MLNEIAQQRAVTLDQALDFNQVVFGSVCYQRWLEWDAGVHVFRVSPDGVAACAAVSEWSLQRKLNNHVLAKRATRLQRHRGMRRVA